MSIFRKKSKLSSTPFSVRMSQEADASLAHDAEENGISKASAVRAIVDAYYSGELSHNPMVTDIKNDGFLLEDSELRYLECPSCKSSGMDVQAENDGEPPIQVNPDFGGCSDAAWISYWCSQCGANPVLVIHNHKGVSMIGWSFNRGDSSAVIKTNSHGRV